MMMRPDHAYFLLMMVSVAIAAYGMSVVIKILKYALAQGVI